MNQMKFWCLGLALGAPFAQAAQPPDIVASDSSGNTAIGESVLLLAGPGTAPTYNTGLGYKVFSGLSMGDRNTGEGVELLQDANNILDNTVVSGNTYGTSTAYFLVRNTLIGDNVAQALSTGSNDVAIGHGALSSTSTGSGDTAVGYQALFATSTVQANTAIGYDALQSSTAGFNTAMGAYALLHDTTGAYNSAFGHQALSWNTTGNYNTACGANVLYSSTTGSNNSAAGYGASFYNTTGNNNVAAGSLALLSVSSGSSNIGLGTFAGYNLTGSNNIDIANLGAASESNVMRIGSAGVQTAAYVAGVYSTKLTGHQVFVDANGRLGSLASAQRFKTDVLDMGDRSAGLKDLRPVTFHLKREPHGTLQYGLIAEEVERVYPDLVIRDADGKVQGVRYDELAPMLLNEIQTLKRRDRDLAERIQAVRRETTELRATAAMSEARRFASR